MHESAQLLTALFGNLSPGAAIHVVRLGGPKSGEPQFLTASELAGWQPDTTVSGNWYFGVVPRSKDGTALADEGTVVWLDVDKQHVDPKTFVPRATLVVNSGHGTQVHWSLSSPVDALRLVRLSRLAALAFSGDRQVCEPKRLMRLPGTMNVKDPAAPVPSVIVDHCDVSYDPTDLTERLAARYLANNWWDGSRHQLALALSAMLCRAGWDIERSERLMRHVCKMSGDREVQDRLKAIEGTYTRRLAGDAVSSAALKEVLEDEYAEFVGCIGTAFRDGDIIDLAGNRVGHAASVEADIARLVVALGDYSYLDGHIVRWDGKRWRVSSPQELLAYIFQTTERLRLYSDGEDVAFPARAKLSKAVSDITVGRLSQCPPTELSTDILPVKNGLLRLSDRTLIPADKAFAIRWVAPVEYDPTSTCPEWETFLTQAVPGVEPYLQEWVGYCLEAGNPWQKMLWLAGESGTGKSTFLGAVAALLGEAAIAMSADHISEYAVASLAGKRVAVCAELSARVLKTSTMKSLVTGDPLPGRHPYGRPFPVLFDGKLVWASNSLPPPDEGEGVWRRIKVVPFDRKPERENPFLLSEILTHLPGLLNWALVGLDRVRSYRTTNSWPEPGTVETIVGEYKDAADTFGRFVEEELIMDASAELPASLLYTRYSAWMRDQGHTRVDPLGPAFWRALKRAGLEPVKNPRRVNGKLIRLWKGADLVPMTL